MRDVFLIVLAGVAAIGYLAYTLTRGSYRERNRRDSGCKGGNGGVFGGEGHGHGGDSGDGGDGGSH